jgi:hypothetical protein
VFDDMWARHVIAEHEAAGREKRYSGGGEPSKSPLFRCYHRKNMTNST